MATPDGNGRKELDYLDVQIKSMTACSDFASHPDYRRLIGRIVAVIIHEALEMGASDIRLDRFEDRVNVRYRVNGAWKQRDCPPARLWHSILAQLHNLAAGGTSQPMFDYIVIDRIPTEIVGLKSARQIPGDSPPRSRTERGQADHSVRTMKRRSGLVVTAKSIG